MGNFQKQGTRMTTARITGKRRTIADLQREKQKKIDRLIRAIRSERVGSAQEASDHLHITTAWAHELRRQAIEQGTRIVTESGRWRVIE